MQLTIVEMTAAHLPQVAELEEQCFANPWSPASLAEELNNPCARFLVAESGDTVAGYLGCHHIADEGYITNVAVFPSFRRQGVARTLLQTAITLWPSLSRITLEVRESNKAAIALYSSCGFVKDGVRPHFYTHPNEDAGIYSYYRK